MAKHTKRRGVRKSRKSVKGGRGTRRQRGGKIYKKLSNGRTQYFNGDNSGLKNYPFNDLNEDNGVAKISIRTMFLELNPLRTKFKILYGGIRQFCRIPTVLVLRGLTAT